MSVSIETKIRTTIENAICSRWGNILTAADANQIVFDKAHEFFDSETLAASSPGQLHSKVRKALIPYRDVILAGVAGQLRGMTFQDVVETVCEMVRHYLDQDLEVVAKPTKAFTGYCEPTEPWNLFCNGYRALEACKSRGDAAPQSLVRAIEMLHLLTDGVVLVEDLAIPFDGKIRIRAPLSQTVA